MTSVPCPSVCEFNMSSCARSKRHRVCRQRAHVLKSMCACCRHTQGRFERAHMEAFESGHGVLTPHTHTHNHTDRERARHTEKTKEKTRQEKMKEKKTEIMMWTDAESKFAQEKAQLVD